ncbi:MAG: hypothetical protein IPK50_00045 [Fibrobacterota bacterium]|nr:MAG: hypothetical protein IPK50_00045 [Fibrobacterota bacterium]
MPSKKIRFCTYEVEAVDIDRFFVSFLDLNEPPDLILLGYNPEYRRYLQDGRYKGANVVSSAWKSIEEIAGILRENRIDLVMVCAHRIPDIHVILAARMAGCRISYLQHGMYIPFMKRTLGFFVAKLKKTALYLKYSLDIGRHKGGLKLTSDLFRIHVLGRDRTPLGIHKEMFPDRAAVFSDYWGRWHETHYAFPEGSWFSMGTPDFRRYSFGPARSDDVVAYCYQTLVEDGRIAWSVMESFYQDLVGWASRGGFCLVVKAHPRSKPQYLDWFRSRGIEIVVDHVPNTSKVVGHYSSLLAFWGIHGRSVLCVRLPGHEIDPSIASWSTVVERLEDGVSFAPVDREDCLGKFGQSLSIPELREKMGLVRAGQEVVA